MSKSAKNYLLTSLICLAVALILKGTLHFEEGGMNYLFTALISCTMICGVVGFNRQ